MADDFLRTLDDVVSGYQGMSSTIGSFAQVLATPAPPPTVSAVPVFSSSPPPPPTMSASIPTPAQVSATAMGYPPSHMPFTPPPTPMGYGYEGGGMMGYGAAQQQIQSNYIQHPSYAAYMSAPGMMNYADASLMTPSSMGAFRGAPVQDRRAVAPYGISGSAPPTALLPFRELERTRPMSHHQRPFDAAITVANEQERLVMQNYEAYARGMGRMAVGAAGGAVLGTVGAGAGAYFGGVKGAEIGMNVGMLAGSLAGFVPGVSEATGALLRPAIERNYDATMMQMTSRNFVAGGRDLDLTGSGLSTGAAFRMTQGMDRLAGQSGGSLTRKDLANIMQVAGEHEMLDMTQNTDEIVAAVGKISKVLGMFAQITGDPDFKNNIKKMGQLRRLGIDIDHMDSTMRNADQFARMAGMDVDQVMQRQGIQGAGIYNSMGMLPGHGMRAGFHATGATHAAINSGSYTVEQQALLGGKSGMEQRLMEGMGATLQGPMQNLMAYYARRGKDGTMGVDEDAINDLLMGRVTFEQALQQGSERVNREGPRFVSDMMTRRGELTEKMTGVLGAEGTEFMMGRLGLEIQRTLGGPDKIGLDTAIGFMTGNADLGIQLQDKFHNPKYWDTMRQSYEAEMRRARFGVLDREFDDGPSRRDLRRSDRQSGVAGWMNRKAERAREEAGGMYRFGDMPDYSMTAEEEARYGAYGDGGRGYESSLMEQFGDFRRDNLFGSRARNIRGASGHNVVGNLLGQALEGMPGAVGEGARRIGNAEREEAEHNIGAALDVVQNAGRRQGTQASRTEEVFTKAGVQFNASKRARYSLAIQEHLDDKFNSVGARVVGALPGNDRFSAPRQAELERVLIGAGATPEEAQRLLSVEGGQAILLEDATQGRRDLQHNLGTDVARTLKDGLVEGAGEGLRRGVRGVNYEKDELKKLGWDLDKSDDKAAMDILQKFSSGEDATYAILHATRTDGGPIDKWQAANLIKDLLEDPEKAARYQSVVDRIEALGSAWSEGVRKTLASKFKTTIHDPTLSRTRVSQQLDKRTKAALVQRSRVAQAQSNVAADKVLGDALGDDYNARDGVAGLIERLKDGSISEAGVQKLREVLNDDGLVDAALSGTGDTVEIGNRINAIIKQKQPHLVDSGEVLGLQGAGTDDIQKSMDRLDTFATEFKKSADIMRDAANIMYKAQTGKDHPSAAGAEVGGNGLPQTGPAGELGSWSAWGREALKYGNPFGAGLATVNRARGLRNNQE